MIREWTASRVAKVLRQRSIRFGHWPHHSKLHGSLHSKLLLSRKQLPYQRAALVSAVRLGAHSASIDSPSGSYCELGSAAPTSCPIGENASMKQARPSSYLSHAGRFGLGLSSNANCSGPCTAGCFCQPNSASPCQQPW